MLTVNASSLFAVCVFGLLFGFFFYVGEKIANALFGPKA